MAYWVTFSNGSTACQTGVGDRLIKWAREAGLPIQKDSRDEKYDYVDFLKLTDEQGVSLDGKRSEFLVEEAQAYIDERWPGQNVRVVSRQSLPYGGGLHVFGSGDRDGHFCYSPASCAGKTSCPRNRACSE